MSTRRMVPEGKEIMVLAFILIFLLFLSDIIGFENMNIKIDKNQSEINKIVFYVLRTRDKVDGHEKQINEALALSDRISSLDAIFKQHTHRYSDGKTVIEPESENKKFKRE